jgi:hypothetical protein
VISYIFNGLFNILLDKLLFLWSGPEELHRHTNRVDWLLLSTARILERPAGVAPAFPAGKAGCIFQRAANDALKHKERKQNQASKFNYN